MHLSLDDAAAAAPPEIMTAEDAAAFLSMKPLGLCKLAREGKVPGRKVGKEWRFSRSVLMTWMTGAEVRKTRK